MQLQELLSTTDLTWARSLESAQQDLIHTSYYLYQRELQNPSGALYDYSFIIFPMAKAYEGYLKDFLYHHHLISKEIHASRKFRIGRALNPDVSFRHRDQWWLYDDVAKICGTTLARELWDVWLECRNRVFHYFPQEEKQIRLDAVEVKLELIAAVIKKAQECR